MAARRFCEAPPEARLRLECWLDEQYHTARQLSFAALREVLEHRLGHRYADQDLHRALTSAEQRHADEIEARECWVASGVGSWSAFLLDWQRERRSEARPPAPSGVPAPPRVPAPPARPAPPDVPKRQTRQPTARRHGR